MRLRASLIRISLSALRSGKARVQPDLPLPPHDYTALFPIGQNDARYFSARVGDWL